MSTTIAIQDLDLGTVDLMDLRWFADGPPHELFARMRRETPVRWNPRPDGSGFWSIMRHADISEISRDTGTFSSNRGGVFLHPDQVMPLEAMQNVLLYKDPPEHTSHRKILQSAFVPHTVRQLEVDIRARVTKLIDAVIEQGRCDFARDIAEPGPLAVLAQLLGVPDADIPKLHAWTEQIEEAQRSPEPAAATETFGAMAAYLHEQIQRQLGEAREDSLVMKLKNAEVDGESLNDVEILMFFGLLVFAGNDTTRNTAGTGMLSLLEHPDQLARLIDDPAAIPDAVEEILRWTTVVQWFARTATHDTEIGGHSIAEGERVVMWYPSASRDEEVYEDPQRFDVTRTDHSHRAFGGGGRHFCLGAGLARLELRVIFEEVLRRMRDIELAGEVERLPSSWAHGLISLPVRFRPGAREA